MIQSEFLTGSWSGGLSNIKMLSFMHSTLDRLNVSLPLCHTCRIYWKNDGQCQQTTSSSSGDTWGLCSLSPSHLSHRVFCRCPSATVAAVTNLLTFFSASFKLSSLTPPTGALWIHDGIFSGAATQLGQIWSVTGSAWFYKRLEILISTASSLTGTQTVWVRVVK